MTILVKKPYLFLEASEYNESSGKMYNKNEGITLK